KPFSMGMNPAIREKLLKIKEILPGIILEDHFKLRPDMASEYSEHQKKNFKSDIAWIISFLAEAVWAGQPALFDEFISWLKTFLASVKVPMEDLRESIELLKYRINEACTDEDNKLINPLMESAISIILSQEQKISLPASDNHLTPLARTYLDCLLHGKRNDALSLIISEVEAGTTVREVYLDVFQPVQYEIGRLWQTNKISVAQEHFCTGATQLIMSQLYPYLFTGEKKNRKMVTACVSGELHEIGARMVTDFFEMEGWDTYYLGANMPVEGIIRFLSEMKPQLLAISATMTFHVSAVEEMIRNIRSAPGIPSELKIMVGGYPFIVAEGLWEHVGANGCALNALEAVSLAEKLIAA
ncbi:MAG: cobalamin-dependent protein, partial [Bacteroidetes bacterium]|nr:cobalamin-dependent protein [Bacteroidota bacterium]